MKKNILLTLLALVLGFAQEAAAQGKYVVPKTLVPDSWFVTLNNVYNDIGTVPNCFAWYCSGEENVNPTVTASSKVSGYEAYIAGTKNATADGNTGAYVLFSPLIDGTITVAVSQGNQKKFYVQESVESEKWTTLSGFDGVNKGSGSEYNGTYTFPVKAYRSYRVYMQGSKIPFFGFELRVGITERNFPDATFRSFVKDNFDNNKDDILDATEIASVNIIDVKDKGIESLEGIRFFTEIVNVSCQNNQLQWLDLGWNKKLMVVYCENNKLESIGLPSGSPLNTLYCNNNRLTALDVTGCTKLNDLLCYSNNIGESAMDALMSSLPTVSNGRLMVYHSTDANEHNVCSKDAVDVAKSKGWEVWYHDGKGWDYYAGVAEGVALDATNFPDAAFREWVSDFDKDNDGELSQAEIAIVNMIDVPNKGIASLKGVEYFTEIIRIDCFGNQLTELDLTNNTKLTQVYCQNNQLTSLVLPSSAPLWAIRCHGNNIDKSAMDALVASLPVGNPNEAVFYVYDPADANEKNVCTADAVGVAKGKNWRVLYNIGTMDNEMWWDYVGIDPTGIGSLTPTLSQGEGACYTLDGRKLNGKPAQRGVYVKNGRKVVKN